MSHFSEYIRPVTFGISVLGLLVILLGVLAGLACFVRCEVAAARGANVRMGRYKLRQLLGYYLLLGLEFLIAADVIDTLLKPEPRELIVLGTIVAIRGVISYTLNAELSPEAARVRESETM